MLNKFSNFFIQRASWKVILIFVILFILFNVLIFPYVINRFGLQGQPMLDFLFGFTPDQAFSVIGGYGEEGRAGVLWISGLVDMIYPFVFGGLLVFLISIQLKKQFNTTSPWLKLNLLPLIAVGTDFIENTGIIVMLNAFPNRADGFAVMSACSGMVKWVFVGLSIGVSLLLFIRILITKKKQR
jgi:tetrahydromethanopterin S-methyltransferase subunit B